QRESSISRLRGRSSRESPRAAAPRVARSSAARRRRCRVSTGIRITTSRDLPSAPSNAKIYCRNRISGQAMWCWDSSPRGLTQTVSAEIDLAAVPPQAVFAWLQRAGNIPEREMLRTFNCGIGMIVITTSEGAEAVTRSLADSGEGVVRLGKIVARQEGEEQV